MALFSVRTVDSADLRTVKVAGECDMSASDELTAVLVDAVASFRRVEVDLAAVEFLDSTGINALVTAYHRACANGSTIYVTQAVGMVATVLDLTGVAQLLSAPVPEAEQL
ncbi:STAS domain-containing protein [Catellatospora tritici]|uniref:STAS domain-containing protein n=1 Tax=Catellatospora tritici TaxID=2851566 RepID=UPI001C2D779D|nr:STAS domain-containing protein [Catellatospora tritici]MBV1851242.1 STAS domain-containing protein [Catellatospora tritici]